MEAKLPTTPGPYWWREKDGDEWRAFILTHVDIEVIKEDIPEFGEAYINGMVVSGGQWAKAHSPDEGQEAFAVRCPTGQFAHISTKDDCDRQCEHLNETDMFLDGQEYDVVPVTIYRNQKKK